ncbi:MAG: hypothetical protein WC466_06195 [Candidatus Izemoplasmatales bacterium]
MAYIVPLDQPLSESQAKLIAQMGSIKNMANLPFLKKLVLKKEDEISLFDYMIKVLRSMGIDPQILLSAFLNDFFRAEKLVEFFLTAVAKLAAAMYKNLDDNITLPFALNETMTDDQIVQLVETNYNWLNSQSYIKAPLTSILDGLKTRMIQELMILIFGKPKKEDAAYGPNGLVADVQRLNELLDEFVCGGAQMFSVSSPSNTNNGDLEYNRIQKLQQVKNGNLTFKITCQGVDISLPDDPMYLFKSVPPGFVGGQTVSPQQAIENILQYVGGQVQKQTTSNSQSNSVSSEKSFTQKLLETLISSITTLVSPFFVGFVGTIPDEAQGMGPAALQMLTDGLLNYVFPNSVTTDSITGKRVGEFVPATSCEILSSYDKNNMTDDQKKKTALMTILCNLLLNMLIGFILAYLIEEVKNQVKKFIAKRAEARIERKTKKMKDRYANSIAGKAQKKAQKTARQVKLMSRIMGLLKPRKNASVASIDLSS